MKYCGFGEAIAPKSTLGDVPSDGLSRGSNSISSIANVEFNLEANVKLVAAPNALLVSELLTHLQTLQQDLQVASARLVAVAAKDHQRPGITD